MTLLRVIVDSTFKHAKNLISQAGDELEQTSRELLTTIERGGVGR